MNQPVASDGIAGPVAAYELAMRIPAGSELLLTAGIVGDRPDGTVADDVGEQAREVWRSIGALLEEAAFTTADIVSYITYVVAGNDLGAAMAARDEFFGDHRAASTLIPVPALARPRWKIEISVVAARQP